MLIVQHVDNNETLNNLSKSAHSVVASHWSYAPKIPVRFRVGAYLDDNERLK